MNVQLAAADLLRDGFDSQGRFNIERAVRALDAAGLLVAAESDYEYGYNTGSTVTLIGRIEQITEWALVRGMRVGVGDWGSRIMRRRGPGTWSEVPGADRESQGSST